MWMRAARIHGPPAEHSVVRTLQDLHFDLLAGPTGRIVNGIGGFCLLLLCVTGPVVWWPGRGSWRRGFAIDWTRPWTRVTWDLHSAVGICTVVLAAMWAATGVYFAFPNEFRAAVNWVLPLTVSRPPTSIPNAAGAAAGSRPTWRTLIELARDVEPDAFVARVVVPAADESAFQVLFTDERPTPVGAKGLRTVYLDPFTGERLADTPRAAPTLGDTIMAWVAPLHVGNFGGVGVRLVWLVTGLAPALLGVTGLILWWTRVVSPRWLRQRVSQAGTRVPHGTLVVEVGRGSGPPDGA